MPLELTTTGDWLSAHAGQLAAVLFVLLATWLASWLIGKAFGRYAALMPSAPASLIAGIVRITVVLVGFTIVLSHLGIAIAPILTALGVGGLAVALALQDTLANLFAGIQLLLMRQIKPGDYVKLDAGEGLIVDITLRNTLLTDLAGSTIVVPNQKVAQSAITVWNTAGPIAFAVPVTLGRDVDLERLERAARDAARRAGGNDAQLRLLSVTADAVQCALRVRVEFGGDPFKVRDAVLGEIAKARAPAGA